MDKDLLELALKQNWKESSIERVIGVSGSPAATKYQCYLSTVIRIKAEVLLGSGRKAKRSVVYKSSQPPDEQGTQFQKKYDTFTIETMMYSVILQDMKVLMDDFEDSDGVLWCNLIQNDSRFLLFEDLKISGFRMQDKASFFDLEQSSLAFHSLGRYHGMVKVVEGRGLVQVADFKKWYVFNDIENHKKWFENTGAVVEGVKKYWGNHWTAIVEKIKLTSVEKLHERLEKLGELDKTRFNVLNHGDLHMNNIMFKKDWKNTSIDIRFLDFQIPHYGSPCHDLTFMLYLGVDPFVRREHYEHLVQVYHTSLVRTLKKYEFRGSPPDLAEIHEILDKNDFFGLYLALFAFPDLFTPEDVELLNIDGYNLDFFKSETLRRALGPDLEMFVKKYC